MENDPRAPGISEEAERELKIPVPLQPKQRLLLQLIQNSPATWIGYGGSRGGGKSQGLRSAILLRRAKYEGTKGLIFRRTFEQLWENHIEPLFAQFPFMREWYHTGHKELTLPNGSAIVFGYAEHAGDIYSFQGKEYMDIGVDEATQLTEQELVFLKTCNRWTGMPEDQCKMILTMNPDGGRGFAFIKRVFIEKQYHENERAGDYAFLQAYGWDNVGWAEKAVSAKQYYSWTDQQRFDYFIANTAYGRSLSALPEALRIGHLMGRWDVFAGQYFDIFDPARHVVRPEKLGIQPWWPRWISIDWGYEHPSAVYWHTETPEGRTLTYREFVADHLSPPKLARAIADRSEGEKITQVFISPDASGKRTSEDTITQQVGDVLVGAGLPFPADADDDRVGGWMLMYQLLESGRWVIAENCPELIACLPALTRDSKRVEDVLKMDGDDPADAARYGLKSRLQPGRAPLDVQLAERVAATRATDPTSIMMRRAQIEEELRKKAQPVRLFRPRHWPPRRP